MSTPTIFRSPKAAEVDFADGWQFVRGWEGQLPILDWHTADSAHLATRRQLRAAGLRPGGQDPVALLRFRHRGSGKRVLAELFLTEKAKPVRTMTPAKQAALDKALRARRTCRCCGETATAELPRAHRTCEACRADIEALDPLSHIHDYLTGEPTLSAEGHAALDAQLAARTLAPVIPLRRTVTAAAPAVNVPSPTLENIA